VAEAPVDALLARADELARRWAIALIFERSLEQIGELDLEAVVREAPALCAPLVRALESDAELGRLADGAEPFRGDADSVGRLGALAGARDAQAAVEAVESLRGVLWEALLDELHDPSAREVADLGDRLAYVCASALAAIVAGTSAAGPPSKAADADAVAGRPGDVSGYPSEVGGEPREVVGGAGQVGGLSGEVEGQRGGGFVEGDRPIAPARAILVDERDQGGEVSDPGSAGGLPSSAFEVARGGAAPRIVDTPEIEVRDARREEGPVAWISSIKRQLDRFDDDGVPFAVLLCELGDLERLRRAALPGGISSLTGQIERVLAEELKRLAASTEGRRGQAGSLTCERPGRYWLLAPATDTAGARRLAEWLVGMVGPLASRPWAPLDVTVGVAVCPDDGREAAVLAAHADIALTAARVHGRSIASVDEPA
jgi:hypothetical protein